MHNTGIKGASTNSWGNFCLNVGITIFPVNLGRCLDVMINLHAGLWERRPDLEVDLSLPEVFHFLIVYATVDLVTPLDW